MASFVAFVRNCIDVSSSPLMSKLCATRENLCMWHVFFLVCLPRMIWYVLRIWGYETYPLLVRFLVVFNKLFYLILQASLFDSGSVAPFVLDLSILVTSFAPGPSDGFGCGSQDTRGGGHGVFGRGCRDFGRGFGQDSGGGPFFWGRPWS